MNKPAQGFPRAGFLSNYITYETQNLPPSGLLLMQVRVPDRSIRSKRRNLYDKNPGIYFKMIDNK